MTGAIKQLAQIRHALLKLRRRSRTDRSPDSRSCHWARYAFSIFGPVADKDAPPLPELRAEMLRRAERDESVRWARALGQEGAPKDVVKVDLDNSRRLASSSPLLAGVNKGPTGASCTLGVEAVELRAGPAAEGQYQPAPADRPSLGEQPTAGQVETVDLGPDEMGPFAQRLVRRR